MEKLTSDLYTFVVDCGDGVGPTAILYHTEYGTNFRFYFANPLVSPNRIWEHMCSLTDSQCHQWLDPIRAEEEKKLAKEEAKREKQRLQALADKERQDKLAKKEENKRKQREALQRKQEAENN